MRERERDPFTVPSAQRNVGSYIYIKLLGLPRIYNAVVDRLDKFFFSSYIAAVCRQQRTVPSSLCYTSWQKKYYIMKNSVLI